MSMYLYGGPGSRTYPHHMHPHQDGVLVVEPGDMIDFGDGLPPTDGLWADEDGNQVVPEPVQESVDDEAGEPGTGLDGDEDDLDDEDDEE